MLKLSAATAAWFSRIFGEASPLSFSDFLAIGIKSLILILLGILDSGSPSALTDWLTEEGSELLFLTSYLSSNVLATFEFALYRIR